MARYTRAVRRDTAQIRPVETVEPVQEWQAPEAADSDSDAAPVVVDDKPKRTRRKKSDA